MRILCLSLPDLVLRTALRAHPELDGLPVVIGGAPSEPRPVLACSAAAMDAGVQPGMRLKVAQSCCPEAVFLPPMPELVHDAMRELHALLGEISPGVEAAAEGMFWIGLDGLQRLWPDERALTRRVHELVAGYGPLQRQIGIADTKYAATLAALEGNTYIVLPGEDARFLHDQPIERLPAPEPTIVTLRTMSITTLGAFAALPANAVVMRFGKDARRLQLLARGFDDARVIAPEAPMVLEARITFEGGEVVRERLLWIVERRLERLYHELEQAQLAPRAIQLCLQLEDGRELRETVTVTDPLLRLPELQQLLRWHLETMTLPAPVDEVLLLLHGLAPAYGRQLGLWTQREEGDVRRLLGELLARWGTTSVMRARIVESRRLEAGWEWDEVTIPVEARGTPGSAGVLALSPALRLLPEPHAVSMTLIDGQPSMLQIGQRRERITAIGGPWRLSEGWWDTTIERDDYQLGTDTAVYYVVHDLRDDQWLLLGAFD